jgi:hypothetical protein
MILSWTLISTVELDVNVIKTTIQLVSNVIVKYRISESTDVNGKQHFKLSQLMILLKTCRLVCCRFLKEKNRLSCFNEFELKKFDYQQKLKGFN